MKCRHCNAEGVPEGAPFCPYCGEPVAGERKPAAEITGNVTLTTLQGGRAAGVAIGTIHEAIIGEARIDEAHVILSPEKEDALIEKVIENITARLGITLAMLKAGEAKVPESAKREIDSVIDDVETQGLSVSPASLYRLGMFAASVKDPVNAARYFRNAIWSDPEYADAYRALAWIQQMRAVGEIENGDLRTASALLREARDASLHTKDLVSLVQQGYNAKTMAQVAEAQGMEREAAAYYGEAASTFQKVLAEDPKDAGALNGLGNVHYAAGELEEAVALYTNAIRINPYYTAAYHDLAMAYEARMATDTDHAPEWCRKAREALNRAFFLAKKDPGFSEDMRARILERIDMLDEKCGNEDPGP